VSNDVSAGSLRATRARQAGRTLLANRITQNYSQFMRCPETDVPADFLHQNALS
jgi:hypothetical protein